MIFHPQRVTWKEGSFVLSDKTDAIAHPCLHRDVIRELWHNFTYRSSTLRLGESEEYRFCVGDAEPLPLDGADYTVNVTPCGICLSAKDEKELVRGYMTLLDRFTAVDREGALAVRVDACQLWDRARIPCRMVHFCVFPETALWQVQKFLRFCGALKYTHVVLEFWGTLRYDCQRELAWESAFSKEELRPLLAEARDLGLEIVPMFNHWGHASASRMMHGKHVVLDQNPTLQTYFSEDGWCWNFQNPKVRALLGQVRAELIELCGEGEYFHIGCDEAYSFSYTEENMDRICKYINEIADDMATLGRRAILWGDMLLSHDPKRNPKNRYTCAAPSAEASRYLLARLSPSIVIADWQYECPETPVESTSVFTEAGFDALLCPWDLGKAQTEAALSTIRDRGLYGLLHTTWHTLSSGMPYVCASAVGCFEPIENRSLVEFSALSAALMRKVMPTGGDYAKAGWSREQVDFNW